MGTCTYRNVKFLSSTLLLSIALLPYSTHMICAISWTTTLCIKSRSNFKILVHMLLQFTFKIWINKMKIYDYPVVHNKVDISAYWTRVVGQENSFMLQEMNVKKVWNQYKRWWRKTKIKFWNSQQSNNPNL